MVISNPHDGSPSVSLACPKCGCRHCYTWGYAPPGHMVPNGGCPSCGYTWSFAPLEAPRTSSITDEADNAVPTSAFKTTARRFIAFGRAIFGR